MAFLRRCLEELRALQKDPVCELGSARVNLGYGPSDAANASLLGRQGEPCCGDVGTVSYRAEARTRVDPVFVFEIDQANWPYA